MPDGVISFNSTELPMQEVSNSTICIVRLHCTRCEFEFEHQYTYENLLTGNCMRDCPACQHDDVFNILSVIETANRMDITNHFVSVTAQPAIFCNRCSVNSVENNSVRIRSIEGNLSTLCRDCYEIIRDSELIHVHSWIPSRFKLTLGRNERRHQDTLFYGTELEINVQGNISKHAKEFHKWLKVAGLADLFYFKRDGSVGNGYEIVTHPMTVKARNELVNWREVLGYLKNTGASSEESGQCGLHIHASRNGITPREIGKLKYFFFANRMAIHKLSRRRNYNYCKIENYRVSSPWGDSTKYLTSYPDQGDRYVCVNVHTGKPTVEFRVMRGTLDYERMTAYFQFTDAVIHFVKSHSIVSQDKPYTWMTFIQWLGDCNNYNHLEHYLKKECI